jgi:peptide/nickel transport system permease protein
MLVVLLLVLSMAGDRPAVFPLVGGVFSAGGIALAVETEVRRILEEPYVVAARVMGAGGTRVAICHVLPNLRRTLVSTVLGTLGPLVQISVLVSFLGVGGGQVSLGSLIREGYSLFPSAWWLWGSGTFVAITMLVTTTLVARRSL